MTLLTSIDGVSYRQIDFWARCGYLRPANAQPGSGVSRLWTAAEAEVARTMGRLVTAGFTPKLAHRVARARQTRLELAPGVFVEVGA
jgi:DNA-binding transcriptional MerR regulator